MPQSWRTYTAAAIAAVVGFCSAVGWLTSEQAQAVLAFAAALGLYGLRVAVGKVESRLSPPAEIADTISGPLPCVSETMRPGSMTSQPRPPISPPGGAA